MLSQEEENLWGRMVIWVSLIKNKERDYMLSSLTILDCEETDEVKQDK